MIKSLFPTACLCLLMACSGSKIAKSADDVSGKNPALIPACLQEKIETLSDDPSEGSPLYVAEYQYKNQTVYYMASHVATNSTQCMIVPAIFWDIRMEVLPAKAMER
jgi:hypothetical protein